MNDFSQKGWVSGKGRSAIWRDINWDSKVVEPQYLISKKKAIDSGKYNPGSKFAYMPISSSTNARTAIATYLPGMPAGHSVFFYNQASGLPGSALVASVIMSTLSFDVVIRRRLGGLNLSEFVVGEAPLPRSPSFCIHILQRIAAGLSLPSVTFAAEWIRNPLLAQPDRPWRMEWSLTELQRISRICTIEAVVAFLFGLNILDFKEIVAECDLPCGFDAKPLNPKGFWRVDKDRDPELRQTILSLIAFQDLCSLSKQYPRENEVALQEFLTQNNGEGWLIPETVRLADYGLGHDERAIQHQPVASRLGPRFFDWQLAQSTEESWRECHLHARNLLGEAGYQQLLAEIEAERSGQTVAATPPPALKVPLSDDQQLQLFS